MRYLLLLNDPPYGSERSYNALRLAGALAGREGPELRVFLMGDAAGSAAAGQRTPNGYYNVERMLVALSRRGIPVGACGTCLDARGLNESDLAEGVHRGSLEELTDWTIWAEKVLVF